MDFNIAIDGPAGAGKSTTARIVADKLKMTYVDTGAMYRAITLLAIRHNKTKPEDIIKLASEAKIDFKENHIYLNGEDVTDEIRNLEVTEKVSRIAAIPEVRIILTNLQRDIAKNKGVVMDGRDIGTTVLPDAKYKFYLTASVKERAYRRYNELISKGYNVTFEQVEKDIIDRDCKDKRRDFSPMAIADDAIIIDTTGKTINEVVNEIIGRIKKGEGSVL